MRLDQALVVRGLCDSRTESQELIGKMFVKVNGVVTAKQTKEIHPEDEVEVLGRRSFVSRGGDKLRGIFQDIFGDDSVIEGVLFGKVALDIGSSTGGFTDFLLKYGISHVDAVDVGKGQFHEKLRSSQQVSLYESTDIRSFIQDKEYDIIVADLSFISLESVFDTILSFGKQGSQLFLLIKPQFEVGKGNTKKGIVKDMSLIGELLKKYEILAKMSGLDTVQLYPCHLKGGDGNQEYFIYAKK